MSRSIEHRPLTTKYDVHRNRHVVQNCVRTDWLVQLAADGIDRAGGAEHGMDFRFLCAHPFLVSPINTHTVAGFATIVVKQKKFAGGTTDFGIVEVGDQ